MGLLVEEMESRFTPGSMLGGFGVIDQASTLLLMAASANLQHLGGQDQVSVPFTRRTIIDLPKADITLISSSNDGRPSAYLDIAHDAVNQSQDVGSVDAVIAAIQAAYAQQHRPVDVIIIANSTTDQQTGIVIGHSYLFNGSKDMAALTDAVNGQVSSIVFLVSNATPKAPLYQQIAWSLSAGNPVEVSGYTGLVGVVDGTPGYFTTNGHLIQYHSM